MAVTQVIIEEEMRSNPNVFVLKFRFPENEVETPSFMIDVKKSKSHINWIISMMPDFEQESLVETKELFKEAIRSSKFELVLGESKNSEFDGELISKLIQLMMWVETITCNIPEFVIKDENIFEYTSGVRKVCVTMLKP